MGFWFEACMIEYNIIEDRTASILEHSKVCKDAHSKKLSNKLSSIEYQIGKSHPIISKKVKRDTVEHIKAWKENRNNIVHNACIRHYDEKELIEVALDGKKLVDEITNAARRVSNLSNKNLEV